MKKEGGNLLRGMPPTKKAPLASHHAEPSWLMDRLPCGCHRHRCRRRKKYRSVGRRMQVPGEENFSVRGVIPLSPCEIEARAWDKDPCFGPFRPRLGVLHVPANPEPAGIGVQSRCAIHARAG